MSAILEPLAAPAKTVTASAAGNGTADRSTTPPADGVANLSGGALTLALAKAARARREAESSGAQGKTAKPDPNGPAQRPAAPAPADGAAKGPDNTNAASSPDPGGEASNPPPDPEAADDAMASLVAQDQPAEDTGAETAADPEAEEPERQSKAVRSLQKRVDKLTAKLKAYEARFGNGTDGDGEPAPAAEPAPVGSGNHPDLAAIDSEVANYESHLRWFDEHPDGGEYRNARGEVVATVPPERVPTLRRAAERKITELTARRAARSERLEAEQLQQARVYDAQALQRYPWLNDPETPEHQQAQGVLAELPAQVVNSLRSHPKARLLLGALVEGMKTLQPPKPKPAPRSTPPKVMGAPSSAAPRMSPNDALRTQLAEAEAAFEKSGSTSDHKRVITLRRQMRRAT